MWRLYLCKVELMPHRNTVAMLPAVCKYISGVKRFTREWGGEYHQYCVAIVDTTDDEHALAVADSEIYSLPIDITNQVQLDTLVTSLPQAWRDRLVNFFDNRNIPRDWVTAATTVRQLIRYVLKYLRIRQHIKDLFPNVNLDQLFNTLSLAQRRYLRNWAIEQGYSLNNIPDNATMRQVIRALIERRIDFNAPIVFAVTNATNQQIQIEI